MGIRDAAGAGFGVRVSTPTLMRDTLGSDMAKTIGTLSQTLNANARRRESARQFDQNLEFGREKIQAEQDMLDDKLRSSEKIAAGNQAANRYGSLMSYKSAGVKAAATKYASDAPIRGFKAKQKLDKIEDEKYDGLAIADQKFKDTLITLAMKQNKAKELNQTKAAEKLQTEIDEITAAKLRFPSSYNAYRKSGLSGKEAHITAIGDDAKRLVNNRSIPQLLAADVDQNRLDKQATKEREAEEAKIAKEAAEQSLIDSEATKQSGLILTELNTKMDDLSSIIDNKPSRRGMPALSLQNQQEKVQQSVEYMTQQITRLQKLGKTEEADKVQKRLKHALDIFDRKVESSVSTFTNPRARDI